jgi:hypothetical protein
LRSARAARLPLVSLELPEPIVLLEEPLEPAVLPEVEGLAPIVPLLLLGVLDELELEDGVLAEPEEPVVEEPEVDGEAVDGVLEPLAPIDVPLLLGVLAEELESLEPLLALGLLLEELLLGVLLLEPEAPIAPVDGCAGVEGEAAPAAAPVPPALLVPLAEVPPLVLPLPPLAAELWAMA